MEPRKYKTLTLPSLKHVPEPSSSLALEHIMLEDGYVSESNPEYMLDRSKARPAPQQPDTGLIQLGSLPTFNADDLLGETDIAHITLGIHVYTLRKTRQNKLLLTK